MRIKSLAVATTLTLLSTSALVGTAHAQKGVVLQPQTAWAVKRVNDDTPNAYCALARRFKQNMILTLAKNENHEMSVALDFENGGFDKNTVYNVTLDPGAGQQRSYKLQPGSGKAFVVRIGNDPKFLSSLNHTGYLRVVIDNETYNFNLADIDDGQGQLDACLFSNILPAAGGESDSSSSSRGNSAQAAQLSDLRSEKDALQKRLLVLEAENEKLRLSRAATDNKAASAAPSVLTPPPQAMTNVAELERLKKQIDSLKTENTELKKLASAPKGSLPKSADVSMVELARENQRLHEMLLDKGDTDALDTQVKELTRQVASLEKENVTLSQKAHEAGKSVQGDLERQITALKTENETLRSNLDKKSSAGVETSGIRKEISDLESENEALSGRIATLLDEKDAIAAQLSFYEGENDRLANSGGSSKQTNEALLEQLRSEIQKIERNNARLLADKEGEIAGLQTQLSDLRAKDLLSDETTEAERQSIEADYTAKIDALSVKNEALKMELVALSKDQSLIEGLKENVLSLDAEKARLQEALDAAEKKFSAIKTELESEQGNQKLVQDLQTEIGSLKAGIADLESANTSLKTTMEQDRAGRDDLQLSLDAARSENETLKAGVVSAETLKEEIAALRDENSSLQEKLDEQLGTEDTKASRIKELLAGNEALRKELSEKDASARSDVTALQESLAALQAQNDRLKGDYEDRIAVLEKSLGEAQAALESDPGGKRVAALEAEVSRLKSDNAMLQANLSASDSGVRGDTPLTITEEIGTVLEGGDFASLKNNLDTLRSENADLRTALSNADRYNDELQDDLEAARVLIARLKNDNASGMQVSITDDVESGQKIDRLQEKNNALTMALEDQKKAYLSLVRDVENMKQNGGSNGGRMPQKVSAAEGEEISKLRVNNKILADENDILRRKLETQHGGSAPMAQRNAVQNVSADGAAAQVKNGASSASRSATAASTLEGRMAQDSERDAITTIAEIEPAAGDGDNGNAAQGGKPDAAVRSVIDGMDASASQNLSEAQRLERSLKNQMDSPQSHSAGQQAPDITAQGGVIEQESLQADSVDAVDASGAEVFIDGSPYQRGSAQKQEAENKGQQAAAPSVEEAPSSDVEQGNVAAQQDAREAEHARKEEEPVVERDAPAAAAAAASAEYYSSTVDVADVLRQAQIGLAEAVWFVESHSSPERAAYQWRTNGNLFGSAHQKPMANLAQFDAYVRDYLNDTEKRCTGDFAVIPSANTQHEQTRIDTYEIACVGAGVDSSVSVMFFNRDGTFTALAHETATKSMDAAMDVRDKIASSMTRS